MFHTISEIDACAKWPIEWEMLHNKTILITGVTGLVGKYLLCVLLAHNRIYGANMRMIAMGRNQQKFYQRFKEVRDIENVIFCEQDICDSIQMDIPIDFIVHLASNAHPRLYALEPIATEMTNILGTNNLLNLAAENKGCRFLFASSGDIYGDQTNSNNYLSEEDCGYINCNTLRAGYIEGKRAGEALCNAYKEEKGVDFVTARLCRVYGFTMQMDDSKAISQFILNAARGEDIVLKSAGNQTFSYLYAFDVITAILTILTKGMSGNSYNVADNKQVISLKELAREIAEISHVRVIYGEADQLQAKGTSSFQNVKLSGNKLSDLGWEPRFSMRKGLKRTINALKSKFVDERYEDFTVG